MSIKTTHIRVHKIWKWIFVAVLLLSKIFFACAVYFYRQNHKARQQIEQLKTELRQRQHLRS